MNKSTEAGSISNNSEGTNSDNELSSGMLIGGGGIGMLKMGQGQNVNVNVDMGTVQTGSQNYGTTWVEADPFWRAQKAGELTEAQFWERFDWEREFGWDLGTKQFKVVRVFGGGY